MSDASNNGTSVPDVLIVGSGPAGSVLATLLRRAGRSVCMLERRPHPRPKPCGESVNPGAVAALRRLGLAEGIEALDPAPLLGWVLRTEGGAWARGDFAPGAEPGWGIPRARFDAHLAGVAQDAGATLFAPVIVRRAIPAQPAIPSPDCTGWVPGLPGVVTKEADGETGVRQARLLVGADGLRSTVGRAIGSPRRRPHIRKISLTCRVEGSGPPVTHGQLVLGLGWTVGLAPVATQANLWNLTVVVDAKRYGREVAQSPEATVQRFCAEAAFAWREGPAILGGPWTSGPFDWPGHRAVADGVLLVGDAIGYFDPLTGQGIYRAIRSAELAAPFIEKALSAADARREEVISGDAILGYHRAVTSEFRQGRWLQRAIERTLSHSAPRDLAIRHLGRAGHRLDAIIRVTGDVLPVTSLFGAKLWKRGDAAVPTQPTKEESRDAHRR